MSAAVDCATIWRHSRAVRAGALALLLLGWGWLGCAPSPAELSPTEALSAFLTALDRSTHAPEQLQVAYDWLDNSSQSALKERASMSASLAGRSVAAWDMLVPGRASFSAYSVPSLRMRAQVQGEQAVVTLQLDGREDAEIPMRRQEGRWRVVLGLKPTVPE